MPSAALPMVLLGRTANCGWVRTLNVSTRDSARRSQAGSLALGGGETVLPPKPYLLS
jgi:hypothetical protein